jgi:hypothetical protein
MVEVSRVSQDLIREDSSNIPYLGIKAYHKEYCTIRMSTARGAGHTTAAAKLAIKRFNNVLFVSPNQSIATRLHQAVGQQAYAIRQKKLQTSNKWDIFRVTSGQIDTINGRYLFVSGSNDSIIRATKAFQFDAIIVDGASMLKPSVEKFIYELLAMGMMGNKYQFFIFIQ